MAQDLLAVFLTSLPVERQFNVGRDTCTYRRGKLQGETIRKIMILKHATLQRFNAASVADINKRRCPKKQTKAALVWPHTTWINSLPPVDIFSLLVPPDLIFSSMATIT